MVSTYVDDDLALRQLRRRLAAVDVGAADTAAGAGAEGGVADVQGFGPGELAMFDLIPGPVAVVHGPDHRVAYVNGAYTELFGARPAGQKARDALPELDALGLLPLMDQAWRSGRARTAKARRLPGGAGRDPARSSYYTFTCTPVEQYGVLVFGADVTGQVEAAERLRAGEARQRAAAVALQRSLLPQELEQPDDLRVAATYQPGDAEGAVGGDWYDVITLGAGRTALVIGDVMGRGVRAAAPPLGTGGRLHTSGSFPLGPGCSAVLYTDGLVERRDQDIDDGIRELERALAGASGSPQVMCDRLMRSLGVTAGLDGDAAVLVVQRPARTGPDAELFRNAALELHGGTEAAPRARAFASGVLASWRFPAELYDLGVLAAGELVANSLQHGTPPMRLRLRRTDRRLIIEVTDGDDHLPRRRRAGPADETGRGISVVATIASSWGSRRTPGGGKAVWCEFRLPGG
ncbi:SpoIIE family protein phosphatase [Streptomyces chattanoogensis]|uniref:ATP-binding SpoIIE family protein phosphatase n=1 Tax=Streptomyces chattanoogensis TaxID=66876 RepID=UPI00099D9D8C